MRSDGVTKIPICTGTDSSFSQGLIIPGASVVNRWDRGVVFVTGNFVPFEVPPAKATGGIEAEEADTINLGFVWHPVPQVTISADYWQIDSASGTARRLTTLDSATLELMEGFAVHRQRLYFPLWELRGDLFLAELRPTKQ